MQRRLRLALPANAIQRLRQRDGYEVLENLPHFEHVSGDRHVTETMLEGFRRQNDLSQPQCGVLAGVEATWLPPQRRPASRRY